MNAKSAVLCLMMISLGCLQPVYAADAPVAEKTAAPVIMPVAPEKKVVVTPPMAPPKMYEYKVAACGMANDRATEDCLNSMARQGWRLVGPWGNLIAIFER